MTFWYALYTKPHQEQLVADYLQRLQVSTYFPTVPAPRRKHRPLTRALFPCYLFAWVDLAQVGLWTLQYAPGMRSVVMNGDTPAQVDASVIEFLQKRLAHVVGVDSRGLALEPGDRVMITAGPLAEMQAVFDRYVTPAGRVRILLAWLKRWTPVEIDAALLRKVTP